MASFDWSGSIASYLKISGTLPVDVGKLFGLLGDACQDAVERIIGRTFDTRTFTEIYDGNNRSRLYLQHDPIWGLTSVSENGTALAVQSSFVTQTFPMPAVSISPMQDSIVRTDGTLWSTARQMNVLVTYAAGLSGLNNDAPPTDLQLAVTYWAAKLFRDRDRVGITSETIAGQINAFTRDVPDDIVAMVARWRRPFLPRGIAYD